MIDDYIKRFLRLATVGHIGDKEVMNQSDQNSVSWDDILELTEPALEGCD